MHALLRKKVDFKSCPTIVMITLVTHMAPRSRWFFGRILTTLVTVVLFLYTALDEIYIHTWFNTENAVLLPLTWIPITACSVAILEWMRRAEKKERANACMQEKADFAHDVGRELGREMREGLEENWKSHVLAGIIAMGCCLSIILLKSPWYIIILMVFISYQIAYYVLSRLFKNQEGTRLVYM